MIIVISHFRVTRSSPKTRFDHERRNRARALSNINSKILALLFLWISYIPENFKIFIFNNHYWNGHFQKYRENFSEFSLVWSRPEGTGGLNFSIDISLCLCRVSICYQWVISDEHVVTKILQLAQNQKLSVILFQINDIEITILTIIPTNRT